jgi:hypothetical protein
VSGARIDPAPVPAAGGAVTGQVTAATFGELGGGGRALAATLAGPRATCDGRDELRWSVRLA